jgi:hypothetical protein
MLLSTTGPSHRTDDPRKSRRCKEAATFALGDRVITPERVAATKRDMLKLQGIPEAITDEIEKTAAPISTTSAHAGTIDAVERVSTQEAGVAQRQSN